MATYTLIRLVHLSPLHVGSGKENYDFSAADLHSDTLSSALAALRAQQGETKDTEEFLSSFTLSSAFPFYRKQYYLPKPLGKIAVCIPGKEEHEYRKQLKSIRYIESGLWKKVIAGEEILAKESQLQGEFLHADPPPHTPLYLSQVNQRVYVPREEGEDATPFFFEWKYFDSEAGLFCLTDASGKLLQEVIRLFIRLGEQGIGTDRNVGGGKFSVETDTLTIENPEDANATLLLSLYLPTEEELKELSPERSRYELLLRGGYLSGSSEEDFRHLRKKSVYMFASGSVFPVTQRLKGKITDLRPNWNDRRMHPIYRSGRPLHIPIKHTDYESHTH
ncbi:MAG: type III-A CRISPR-associated RAMP protein Csm4 [Bacteroides sp.]|nr:type III-A CRISPR-associated RAMP protein Csm4 [Bacteroides sp.]